MTRALNGIYDRMQEGPWDDILDKAAEYVHEKGTNVFKENGYWYAQFDVHMEDDGRDAGDYTINAWAKDLDRDILAEMKDMWARQDAWTLSDGNIHIAIAWGWASWWFNRTSAGGYVKLLKFEHCKEHEIERGISSTRS